MTRENTFNHLQTYRLARLLTLTLLSLSLCSCETLTQFQAIKSPSEQPGGGVASASEGSGTIGGESKDPAGKATPPAPPTDPKKVVCDPFGNDKSSSVRNGLKAKLFYLSDPADSCNSVAECQSKGTKPDLDLYFSQLNVPTRSFDQGFSNQNGKVLTSDKGQTLIEWFSIHFEATIKLKEKDQPGKYQFAVASDDGSILRIGKSSQGAPDIFKTLINNDGSHSVIFKCASETVRMDTDTALPIKLDYYQGPRFNIALVLLWRQIPDSVDEILNPEKLQDAACDQHVDSAQGWKVVDSDNFILPKQAADNPCSDKK